MASTKATHPFASPKVAMRIARRSGEEPRPITVRLVGKEDVDKLVSGINQAQKSSFKKGMRLD